MIHEDTLSFCEELTAGKNWSHPKFSPQACLAGACERQHVAFKVIANSGLTAQKFVTFGFS